MSRAEIAENSSPVDIVLFPFRLIWGFIIFMIFAWTTSRRVRPFILSFPAVLGIIVFVAAAWAAGFKGKSVALARSYGTYLAMSNKESPFYDPPEAVHYARKAADLDPFEPEFKYQVGLGHDLIDQDLRAFDVMSWLAPGKHETEAENAGQGYSKAHLWMAGHYWIQEDLTEEERIALAREHMQLSYNTDKENVFAVLGLAGMSREDAEKLLTEVETLEKESGDSSVIAQKKRMEKELADSAVRLFREAINLPLQSDRQLYASLAIIEILQKRGRDAEAKRIGQQFIIKHEKNAHLYPDALPFWISIVRTCMLIDEYDKANEFILRGYQLASNPEVRQILAQLAAQIKVEESKTFEDMDDEVQFLKKLFSLCNAIQTNVQVLPAYRELMYFVDEIEAGSDQEFWLQDSLLGTDAIDASEQDDPRLPGIIHIVLGFRDLVNGRRENGLEHWEIASQQFDYAPLAINFMLQVYVTENKLSHKKKLYLANRGLERFPQSPFFYATRGRFHLDDEYYEDAANDLRRANSRIPGNINIIENLLEALKKIEEAAAGDDVDETLKKEIEQLDFELAAIKERIAKPEKDELSKFVQETAEDYKDSDSSE